MTKLVVGSEAPDFQTFSHEGRELNLAELRINGPVVLFFYPRDFTSGCTAQACSFRDTHDDFSGLGATIIGVSADSIESHKKFANKYNLPFHLVSDRKRLLHEKYQVGKTWGILPERITFIIDRDGTIKNIFDSAVYVNKHSTNALEKIHQLTPDAY